MPLIPRRVTLPRLPDSVQEESEDLFKFLLDMTKQLNRMYDDVYKAIRSVEDRLDTLEAP